MNVRDIYRNNMCGTKEFVEDGMIFPYFVGVFNGVVIGSDNQQPRYMTEEEFCKENDFDFDTAKPYATLEEFLENWYLTTEQYNRVCNTRKE